MRWALLCLALTGCATREIDRDAPVFADVTETLTVCRDCHAGDAPAAGWIAGGYLEVIACPSGAGPAVEPADASAPILGALSDDVHAGVLTDAERALVEAWVVAGAPARRGSAHPPGFVDPRSPDFHGAVLREESFARMVDEEAAGACASCHARGVEGATPCASCHTDEGGPLACTTCHGPLGHPPRDPCFHPEEVEQAGAHAAHAELGCAPCHGPRSSEALGPGTRHGDGVVQLTLRDPASDVGRFDPETRTCATPCHDRGGAVARPAWDTPLELDCNGCHQTPPPDHWTDGCDRCHDEAHPDGTALFDGPLHVNGRVDLGDGSGGCGACHGELDGGPASGAHGGHARPATAEPVGCESCHVVPEELFDEGHLDRERGAEVTFGPLASARGATASYDAASGTCAVYCHGDAEPDWENGDAACGSCHGVPPPPPHPVATTCSALACHGGYATAGPGVSAAGRAVHVDGRVDLWPAE